MYNKKIAFLTIAIFFFLCYSCKDDLNDSTIEASAVSETSDDTTVGSKLTNPYTVENMEQAYASLLSGSSSSTRSSTADITLPTTDYYVRFDPEDEDELKLLQSDSLDLFPYPLDYDIEDNDIDSLYESTDTTKTKWYYTSVPVDYDFPDVKYEILADLFLPESVEEDDDSDTTEVITSKGLNITGGFLARLETRALELAGDTADDSSVATRSSKKHPTGYVYVKDTELDEMVPVQGIHVRTRRWFKYGNAYTNSSGYYKISTKYKHDVHYSILCENSIGFKISKHFTSVGMGRFHFGKHSCSGHTFNFTVSSNPKEWRMCTVNNAVVKYWAFCDDLGIGTPPSNIRVLARNKTGKSSAPMLRHVYGTLGFTSKSKVLSFLGKANGVSLTASVLNVVLKYIEPDIIVCASPTLGTADIYSTCFHELTHAAHYNKVGDTFWVKYINYIITYGCYGKGTGNNAGLCALAEAWAYNMGYYLTLKEYTTTSNEYGDNSYLKHSIIERFTPYEVGDKDESHTAYYVTKNGPLVAQTGWIPAGLMNDLVDSNADQVRSGYTDNVSGYTYEELFDALDKDVTTPQKFMTRLLSENSSKQSSAVKSLFTAYYWN